MSAATQAHAEDYSELYSRGALDPKMHRELVLDLDNICATAGVRKRFVSESMATVCTREELDWVRNFPTHAANNVAGLVYVGSHDIEDRMSAVCGAFLRNFIDARVLTVHRVLDRDDPVDPQVMLIPNFHLGKSAGGDFASWQTTRLYDILLGRFNREKITVIAVRDLDAVGAEYGSAFEDHIRRYYTPVS